MTHSALDLLGERAGLEHIIITAVMMGHNFRPVVFLLLIWVLFSDGSLEVVHDNGSLSSDEAAVFQTATFLNYGPQDAEVLRKPLLFIPSGDICDVSSQVQDRVVFTRLAENTCTLSELYDKLEAGGAAALVVQTFTSTPGFFTFMKSEWTGRPDGKLPCYDVVRSFDGLLFSGSTVNIRDSHNRDYENMFRSWPWTLTFRVILPIFALSTSYLGFQIITVRQARRVLPSSQQPLIETRRSRRHLVGLTIGTIEMVINVVIALALALGNYGPMMMPLSFHIALFLLLLGSTLFSTTLLALLAREKTRNLNSLPERDVWTHYKGILTLSAVVFLGCDLLGLVLMVIDGGGSVRTKMAVLGISIPFFLVGIITVGFYFLYQVTCRFI
jgi:hypothetical protein